MPQSFVRKDVAVSPPSWVLASNYSAAMIFVLETAAVQTDIDFDGDMSGDKAARELSAIIADARVVADALARPIPVDAEAVSILTLIKDVAAFTLIRDVAAMQTDDELDGDMSGDDAIDALVVVVARARAVAKEMAGHTDRTPVHGQTSRQGAFEVVAAIAIAVLLMVFGIRAILPLSSPMSSSAPAAVDSVSVAPPVYRGETY